MELINEALHRLHEKGMDVILCACMYCDKIYDAKDGEGVHGLSHGICPTCLPKAEKELSGEVQ